MPTNSAKRIALASVASACMLWAGAAQAKGFCTATSFSGFGACHHETKDDFWEAKGICLNIEDRAERGGCFSEAWSDLHDGREECGDQFEARLDLCGELGEARYDPDVDPDDFESDFSNPTNPNPYWPLGIGNQWVYEAGDETITVDVLNKTKLIEDVHCIVVKDIVEEDGLVFEDTDDWYALGKDGLVRYCGEVSREYEHPEGDMPPEPELVSLEGSWKDGEDGAKSGVLMFAEPSLHIGHPYRQEWAFLDAEDIGEVLSADYSFGEDAELDEFVPEDLVNLLCNGGCVVIRDSTTIEPGHTERKYFAPGIGLFLEVDEQEGDVAQLVSCNVDPACAALPTP